MVYGNQPASAGGARYALGYLAYATVGKLVPAVYFVWVGDREDGRLAGMTGGPRGET